MTIDDERHAFTRDLLRVLTSLYSWAGAVVNGTTEDGHDVIETADGRRCWTEKRDALEWIVRFSTGLVFSPIVVRGEDWDVLIRMSAQKVTDGILSTRIRDLLTGPPEDA